MSAKPALAKDTGRALDPNVLQRRASAPEDSVWVNASAGTGKTKVLTDRVLRLLLPREDGRPGTAAHRILCLTFTKAAASEMLQRIGKTLSEWATMPEEKLKAKLRDLTGREATGGEIGAARRLFAAVVDTPGGLKVMTIHSFCQSVLGRFPLEAGLPPHFSVIDESAANELLTRARDSVLEQARREPGSPLGVALTTLAAEQNEEQFGQLMAALCGERLQLQKFTDAGWLHERLCALFSLAPTDTTQSILLQACEDKNFNKAALYNVCRALANGSSTDQQRGLAIQLWLDAANEKRAAQIEEYRACFLTQKNEVQKKLVTNGVAQAMPDAQQILTAEAERLRTLLDRLKAVKCAALTRDLLLVGSFIVQQYQRLKEERAQLDYDDLVLTTRKLLRQPDISPWILYKLDGGLDHVLIDEAQDTNPEQWEIIRLLCDDFFSGSGVQDATRTVFTVGDEKQSIYSFQRASPHEFARNKAWLKDNKAVEVNLDISFRSTSSVLTLVDEVFAPDELRQGVGTQPLRHHSHRRSQAGLVELWPRCVPTPAPDEDPWTPPVNIIEAPSGQALLAEQIGRTIQGWIENEELLESQGRAVRPGDIMILVRTRTAFVGQLVRALKTKNIPVSGVDRMVLGEQIAVMDLLALAQFALLPADDLSLACALKSPFIGMDEDRLFALASGRKASLWNAVREQEPDTAAWLEELTARAASDRPYEFFSRILQRPCPAGKGSGLRAVRGRLGNDAIDPLDEFLNAALRFEQNNIPTLQGFLLWQQQDDSAIKRELEEAGESVRIMTVHGSKGLQAPIVILPDTVRTGAAKNSDLLWPDKTGLAVPLWAPRSDDFPALYKQARANLEQAMDEEYRRLLYVAMTRAEDRLYIGGYQGKKPPLPGSWYNYIAQAFSRLPEVESDGPVLRLRNPQTGDPDCKGKKHGSGQHQTIAPEPWLFRPAPAESFPPRPLAPSRPSSPEPAVRSPLDGADEYRFRRGNVTHKLLQILPGLKQAEWRKAAERFVALHDLTPEIRQGIIAETFAILDHPAYAPLFGPGSLAEVPLTGFVKGQLVSAQIDRLLVTDSEVSIVDYKTNRPPPQAEKDIPQLYRDQLRGYRDIVASIYPGRRISCFLLWTDGPTLMELENLG